MARVTVEDCLKNVDSHFDLVEVVVARVEQIKMEDESADPMIGDEINEGDESQQKDKLIVRSLREIAAGLIDVQIVKDREARRREFDFDRETSKIKFDWSTSKQLED